MCKYEILKVPKVEGVHRTKAGDREWLEVKVEKWIGSRWLKVLYIK